MVSEMQFWLYADTALILIRLQEEYHAKEKLYVDLDKCFHRLPMNVLFRSLINLYGGANTRVRVDSKLSEQFEVK